MLTQGLQTSIWDTDDPNQVLLAQERLASLIAALTECSGGGIPFACPYDFTASDFGWNLFPNSAGFVPSTRGQYVPGAGWQNTDEVYSGGANTTSGIAINKVFSSSVQMTSVHMAYSLAKGTFTSSAAGQTGIVIRNAGGVVATQLIDASTDPDGLQSVDWSGSVTADEVILVLMTSKQEPTGGSSGLAFINDGEILGEAGVSPC
jgi:hypothetical protein